MNVLLALPELTKQKKPAALCTVVAFKGSTPRKVGAKMVVIANGDKYGSIIGTVGGGAIEHHIRQKALEAIVHEKAELVVTSLRNDLAMCCGGEMSIFIEPLVHPPSLLLFGAGHIAKALCPLALSLDFSVNVVDERAELLEERCFERCQKHEQKINAFVFDDLPFGPKTFIVVATHDHALDQQIIEYALVREFHYLALVGSLRKALMTKKRLQAKGMDEELLKKIICPAGLSINAQTPQEIAVAIAAQMIHVRHA